MALHDRIRKYDDWEIQRPASKSNTRPQKDNFEADEIVETSHSLDHYESDSNSISDSPKQAGGHSFEAVVEDHAQIDPDTGLPIPDYMKPFINRN